MNMKVRMKDRWKRLDELEHGQTFSFKGDIAKNVWQVAEDVENTDDAVACNHLDSGCRGISRGADLVEVVKGRWMPDEPEGMKELYDTAWGTVVEHKGVLYYHSEDCTATTCTMRSVEDSVRVAVSKSTLVRVVHGTFIEDGAKQEKEE